MQSSAADAPEDVLRQIFCYLGTGFSHSIPPSLWLRCDNPELEYNGESISRHTLCSAALVNQHWSKVAKVVLYQSIRIEDQVSSLLFFRTLEDSPDELASWVLRLDLPGIGYECLKEDTEIQIAIIVLCQNLMHLRVRGYNRSVLRYFMSVLRHCKQLRSLYLRTDEREVPMSGNRRWVPSCGMAGMLEMIQEWKDLEDVYIERWVLLGFSDRMEVSPLPRLKSFSAGIPWGSSEFMAMMRVAPNLETFGIKEGYFSRDASESLVRALEHWKDTLIDLDLRCEIEWPEYFTQDWKPWTHVPEALPSLSKLRHLKLGQGFPSSSFSTAFPGALETLYIQLDPDDVHLLVTALQKRDYVPGLRILQVNESYWGVEQKFEEEQLSMDNLIAVCERRQCQLKTGPWSRTAYATFRRSQYMR